MADDQTGLLASSHQQEPCAEILCVRAYIERIWNAKEFEYITRYLHPRFVDYSFPFDYMQNIQGVITYLRILESSISFNIEIVEMDLSGDLVLVQMILKVKAVHLCCTADREEVSMLSSAFQMQDGLIIAHCYT
jgi:hypothetical protein